MKKKHLKIFVVSSLCVTDLKDCIECNYSSFPIIFQGFEYDKQLDKWRLIVTMKSEPLSSFKVCLRSQWLCSSWFFDAHSNLKKFICDIDERPF